MTSSSGKTLYSTVKSGISSRLEFTLIPSKTAIIVIDVQDHLNSSDIGSNMVLNIVRLLNQMRRMRDHIDKGCEVVITYLEAKTSDCRDISLDYKLSGPKFVQLPNILNPATFKDLPKELTPSFTGKGDVVLPKTSCSVFQSTNIDYILRNLQIEQIVITGQLTDQCILSTVRDAADLGYFVTVVEDACCALNNDDHLRGLQGMTGFARIMNTQNVLRELMNYSYDATKDEDPVHVVSDLKSGLSNFQTIKSYKEDVSLVIMSTSEWSSSFERKVSGANSALLRALKYAKVKFIRFAALDISSSIRTKAIPISRLMNESIDGLVLIAKVCMAALPSYADQMIPETGIDAKDSLSFQPDFSTLRILPYSSSSAMVLGTMHDHKSGELSEFCTRGLLDRVLMTAKARQVGFAVGVEIEFTLVRKTNSGTDFNSVDSSIFSAPTTLNDQAEFIDDLHEQLTKQGILIELLHAESAPGQLEIVLPYESDVMKIADNVVLAKETIKEVAKRHDLFAVFVPKMSSNHAGNGMHVHLSTIDLSSDQPCKNSFVGVDDSNISNTGKSFLEGILLHLPALTAITLSTTNSFARIGPGCWTGYSSGWEIEDKESPLRVCYDSKSKRLTNVEMKLVDNLCNIYLALSTILWAGLDGIVRDLELRPCERKVLKDNHQYSLPRSLEESLEYLKNDQVMKLLLGENFMKSYCAVKKAEIENDISGTDIKAYILNHLSR